MSSKKLEISVKQFIWRSIDGSFRLNFYCEFDATSTITIEITDIQARELMKIGICYVGRPLEEIA